MKNEIVSFAPFVFGNTQIRTITYKNEPWFVAADVCKALNISNVTDALYKLDDDEKETIGLTESQAGHGAQSLNIISESGMYTLVLRCRDAIKKGSIPHKFRKWVTNEVLPSVRKTGTYSSKSFDINYPLTWYPDNFPFVDMRFYKNGQLKVTQSMLTETKSPSKEILSKLESAGYDVTAAKAEIESLRHTMIEMSWALGQIASFAKMKDVVNKTFTA
ncbi:hypothetical protein RGP42_003918 [Providencia rettgeri]|nr:hypothetical protein [Providencia rettgeri]ELR5156764.1 hypothetical protein [Providencia rettgeri]ELR5183848.1 hypothetical protein [Providencia rettgeri]ELR5266790.1 hypothetical protein [Providencia rettgeri]ELR5276032.1 hypothetical protein [Providencia rettgeri]